LSSLSPIPAEPTVEQLLVLLAERDARLAEQGAALEALMVKVAELEARLAQNPRNSSRPPSSEGYAKPRSPSRAEQKAKGRSPGKQPGAPGAHLRQVEMPDEVIEHAPAECGGCGADLGQAPVAGADRRQVFDLPPARVHVAEHRLQRRVCECGTVTTATAPAGVSAPAMYGPRLRALAVYYLHVQHLPTARVAALFVEVHGVAVSEGFLTQVLADAGAGTGPFLDAVRADLVAADVAHFDETGVRVTGCLQWLHSASTDKLTLLGVHTKRGAKGIEAVGVLPTFTGVAVHDGWFPYRQYEVEHGLCNAHHLRELTAAAEREPDQGWPSDLADLLREANRAAHAARAAGHSALDPHVLARIQNRYAELITVAQAAHPPPPPTGRRGAPCLGKTRALIRRLDGRRDEVLRFATDLRVPFTNNQAERDLRMAKLQMKISGCWRTTSGADTFCALRSYVSTARKNGTGVMDALTGLIAGTPWQPAPA
jgi:transposase